jgi:osmotically inducible protein OsmC
LAVELDVNIEDIELDKANELVAKAHQVCPYSNATRGNVEVKLAVTNN